MEKEIILVEFITELEVEVGCRDPMGLIWNVFYGLLLGKGRAYKRIE